MLLHGFGGALHSIDDARMRAAAADVSLQGLNDFVRSGRRFGRQQADAAQNHSGSAVGALKRTGIKKRLLHWVEPAVLGKPFDGNDGARCGGADGNLARAPRSAVEQHGARTALTLAAPVFCSGEPEIVAEGG